MGGTTLWAIIAGGVVLAFVRRRRAVAALRAAQQEQEELEDAIAEAWAQRQQMLGSEPAGAPPWVSRSGTDEDLSDTDGSRKPTLH
jgi:hypothetical protein